jgi:hypothetical protein
MGPTRHFRLQNAMGRGTRAAFAMPGGTPPTWSARGGRMRPTPLQTVKKTFEGRAKLVEQLAGMVDKQNGDTTTEEVKSRLMGLSNKKLLRLYQVEEKVRQRFGDRTKLVAHIVDARKKAGLTADEAFQTKLETYSKARLLDLANMGYGEKPVKRSAAEKTADRRGRKAKDRAKSAQAKNKPS